MPAGVRRADLQAGKRSKVPSKIRCHSKIVVSSGLPMRSVSPAVAGQPLVHFLNTLRVHKNQATSSSALFPPRIELGIGEFIAIRVAADGSAPHIVLVDAFFDPVGGHLRKLRGPPKRTPQILGDRCCQLLVFKLDHLLGHSIDPVPPRVDAQHLYVVALSSGLTLRISGAITEALSGSVFTLPTWRSPRG